MGGARNAPTNYALPNQRIMIHSLTEAPLRTSSMRTLGGAGNTFANESFMDELAYAAEMRPAGISPAPLDDPRGRDVAGGRGAERRLGRTAASR